MVDKVLGRDNIYATSEIQMSSENQTSMYVFWLSISNLQ